MTPRMQVRTDPASRSVRFALGDTPLTSYCWDDRDVPAAESPRPYFADLRTTGGTLVGGDRPADHPWHRGLSIAVANVGPFNFWGGPTWIPGEGYVAAADHGRQQHVVLRGFDLRDGFGFDHLLDWIAPDGRPIAEERRTVRVRVVDPATWSLGIDSWLTCRAPMPLSFGTPATRGRTGAGYGGIFWRGPASARTAGPARRAADTASLTVEQATGGAATVCMAASPADGAPIWFSRTDDYVGLGLCPFAVREAVLEPGGSIRLRAGIAIADGFDVDDRTRLAARAAGAGPRSRPRRRTDHGNAGPTGPRAAR